MKPVQAGDSIQVCLTVKHKTPRNESYGEVRWHVSLSNQDNALLAEYELLTMNAYMQSAST
jgi:oxepin-CoA hydrolase/3-oxo-5,6-dehydrosuberyl-CoA semialdehyde dehydrogenase